MNARTRRTSVVLTSILALAAVIGMAQAPVAPMGIIATPPDSELEVSIWVDKGAYALGESITIHYSVNQAAYIYVWDIQPDGIANQLFPYPSSSTQNNYVQAGEHTLPAPPGSSGWIVAPPTGTEYLQILATTTPVQPFAYMSQDPTAFQQSIEAQILGILPVDQRSWGYTSFEIVSGTAPSYGTLVVNSTPSGALISIDGAYAGYTPRTLFVRQGFHRLSVTKSGYLDWNAALYTIAGLTRTVNVTLEPIVPVNAPPVALFAYSPSAPNVGEWIQFDASASVDPDGSIASYSWNFGNGQTAYGSTAWQRYMAAGTYTVTLIVTDDDGASDSVSQTVRVGPTHQAPSAAFAFSPTNPAVDGWVQFDGSGSTDPDGSIVSHSWNFGDGTSGTGVVAWHRFTAPGAYLVTLTVQDDDGATDSTSQSIQVGTVNLPPTAAFAFTPSAPRSGEWIRFDGTGSTDADGTIVAHTWAFGDGTSGSGSTIYHQYSVAGTYVATLTVRDDDGATHSTSRTVAVGTTAQAPVAAFAFSPTSPQAGAWVQFDASGSSDPDGSIVSYAWSFGDGRSGSGVIVWNQYAAAGTYTVTLTVRDDDGLSSTRMLPITVSSAGGTPTGGRPPMGSTPGFFVWGTDSWHVTVNAGSGWLAARDYRIELRTDASFENVGQSTGSGSGSPAPMGVIPTPIEGGKTLIYEGSLQTGSIDHTFRIPDSQSMWLKLQLDIDGDGDLDTSTSFVYLRYAMVHPPTSPFVVGLPSGSTAELVPSLNFRIGNAISYTATTRFVYWTTTISQLENP